MRRRDIGVSVPDAGEPVVKTNSIRVWPEIDSDVPI